MSSKSISVHVKCETPRITEKLDDLGVGDDILDATLKAVCDRIN